MKWHERLAMVRRYGPPSPTLRHVLEVLASYDADDGRSVWPGNQRLAAETGLSGRHITRALAALVRAGWLKPEKEARESRPSNARGGHAWWAHGNLGGRKNSTRYRITYRTETLTPCPDKRRQAVRVRESPPGQTLTPCPPNPDTVSHNPDRLSGDPLRTIKEQREGSAPLPTPHPGSAGEAGASPPWPAAARREIQAAMVKAGCQISDTASLQAWEAIMADIGIQTAKEVSRAVYDLVTCWTADATTPPARPLQAVDLSPYVPAARRSLDAIRALKERMAATLNRKETA